MKYLFALLTFSVMLSFSSCITEEPEEPTPNNSGTGTGTGTGTGSGTGTGTGTGTGSGSGSTSGSPSQSVTGNYWSRNDGVRTAYLYLSGSTAKACADGKETIGTFKSSYPQSMTFVVSGNSITFPLQFEKDGTNLLVGVPQQAINTNTATWYKKGSTYTCNSSTGGGGTTTPAAKGSVVFFTNLKKTGYAINVYVKVGSFEQSAFITQQHASSPGCSSSGTGAAQFGGLEAKSYSWRATGYKWHASGTPTPTTWGGTVTITGNGCASIELK